MRLMRLIVDGPRRQWRDIAFILKVRDQAANPSPSLRRTKAVQFDVFHRRHGHSVAVVVKGGIDLGRPVHYRSGGIGPSGPLDGLRRHRRRRRRHTAQAISLPGLGDKPERIIVEARRARLFRRLMEHVNVPTHRADRAVVLSPPAVLSVRN
jgi:hypothetical protein